MYRVVDCDRIMDLIKLLLASSSFDEFRINTVIGKLLELERQHFEVSVALQAPNSAGLGWSGDANRLTELEDQINQLRGELARLQQEDHHERTNS